MKKAILNWWNILINKPNNKEIYWEKIVSILVVIVGFGIFIYFNQMRVSKLKKQRDDFAIYTIGIIKSNHRANAKASPFVEYEYFFNNIKFSNSQGWIGGISKMPNTGTRYYVKFESNNPRNSEILYKFSVPDSIIVAPDSGWNFMPGAENKK